MPAEKDKKIKPQEKTNSQRLIYCGPSLSIGLQRYAIYKGGIPEHLKTAVTKCPEIKELFVPPNELYSVRKAIAEPGTYENALYSKVLEFEKEAQK